MKNFIKLIILIASLNAYADSTSLMINENNLSYLSSFKADYQTALNRQSFLKEIESKKEYFAVKVESFLENPAMFLEQSDRNIVLVDSKNNRLFINKSKTLGKYIFSEIDNEKLLVDWVYVRDFLMGIVISSDSKYGGSFLSHLKLNNLSLDEYFDYVLNNASTKQYNQCFYNLDQFILTKVNKDSEPIEVLNANKDFILKNFEQKPICSRFDTSIYLLMNSSDYVLDSALIDFIDQNSLSAIKKSQILSKRGIEILDYKYEQIQEKNNQKYQNITQFERFYALVFDQLKGKVFKSDVKPIKTLYYSYNSYTESVSNGLEILDQDKNVLISSYSGYKQRFEHNRLADLFERLLSRSLDVPINDLIDSKSRQPKRSKSEYYFTLDLTKFH